MPGWFYTAQQKQLGATIVAEIWRPVGVGHPFGRSHQSPANQQSQQPADRDAIVDCFPPYYWEAKHMPVSRHSNSIAGLPPAAPSVSHLSPQFNDMTCSFDIAGGGSQAVLFLCLRVEGSTETTLCTDVL